MKESGSVGRPTPYQRKLPLTQKGKQQFHLTNKYQPVHGH